MGEPLGDSGPFINLGKWSWWSSTEFDANKAYYFNFASGNPNGYYSKSHLFYIWAVRNGDSVPKPKANAGLDQTVHGGALVTLDGSQSYDPDGNYPLIYGWEIISKPESSTAILSDSSSVNPTFTTDLVGDYTIELVVTDSKGFSSQPDHVLVSTYSTPPVADAGLDQVIMEIGSLVELDGTQSYDNDGDPITYLWTITTKPVGSATTLSYPTSVTPTFVADVHGEYVVELVVSDPWVSGDPDIVAVSFENVKPVADAGVNQSTVKDETVYLDGSGSFDANLDPLTYSWSFVSKPTDSVATFSDPTSVQTSFVANLPGEYIVSLVVNDGFADSDPSNVSIVATSAKDILVQALDQIINMTNGLDPDVFKNSNMRNTTTNKINAALAKIDKGFYQDALDKLEYDILAKTDGCVDLGGPDKNDWLTTCEAQGQAYPLIIDAIGLLESLI